MRWIPLLALVVECGCSAEVVVRSDPGDASVGSPHGDLAVATCSPACAAPSPFCSASHHCVPCLVDTDCPIGHVCKMVGSGATSCVAGCASDERCRPNGAGSLACCGGACLDTAANAHNCGACGMACQIPNATAICSGGKCGVGQCDPGWSDCNKDPSDGCEVGLRVDANNCMACGTTCSFPNGIAACGDGCYLGGCQAGFDNCDDVEKNGCEVTLDTDPLNCGSCGTKCTNPAHAKAACVSGACSLTCDNLWGDCNQAAVDGCEHSLAADANNCGACGNACAPKLICVNGGCTCPQCNIPNASSKCVNNQCVFDKCNPGYADCDNNAANGCEVDITSSVGNCGGCGNACPNNLPICGNGVCKMIVCLRIGWKFGNDNWACPGGMRLPTVNEINTAMPCISNGDVGMFGYYHDIATAVGGCNCKWNGGWCGQPSIETIRGGRMCGDFNQLQICVSQ